MNQYIIVTGNPVDGFQFHGPPFEQLSDDIADHFEGDWWVAPLTDDATPGPYEGVNA